VDSGLGSAKGSLASRAGRWYGGQSVVVRVLVVVIAVALIARLVYFAGNAIGDEIGGILVILFAFVAYFFPSIVADRRDVPNKGSVRIINLFLGWTLIGWVAALAMAMAGSGKASQTMTTRQGAVLPTPSDVRPCPYCAEDIKKNAIVCKHCGRDVPAVG